MNPHRVTTSHDNKRNTRSQIVIMARTNWEAIDKAMEITGANHAHCARTDRIA